MVKLKYDKHYKFIDGKKACCKCGLVKKQEDFSKDKQKKSGYRPDCKDCNSKRQKELFSPEKKLKAKEYQKNNPEKIKKWKLNERIKNSERYRKVKREYYLNNKDILSAKQKVNYQKNKTKIHEQMKNKYHSDIQYKLKLNLRRRMNKMVRRNERNGSAVKDLGCSLNSFKQYIESKFQIGMTWENYGKWHLDHIYPLSKVDLTNREQFLKVAHFTNYQPLWAKDNISKSNKLENLKHDN